MARAIQPKSSLSGPACDLVERFAEVPADPGLVDDPAQFLGHRRFIFLGGSVNRPQQAVPGPEAAGKHLQRVRHLIVELLSPPGDQQVQEQR